MRIAADAAAADGGPVAYGAGIEDAGSGRLALRAVHGFQRTSRAPARQGSGRRGAAADEVRRVARGGADGLDHARFVRFPGARDVEGRPVVHAGAQNRHPAGDGHGAREIEGLAGDVPLVVVERHHRRKATRPREVEHRIRRNGTFHGQAFRAQRFDGGREDGILLVAEKPVFAAVGVERGQGERAAGAAELRERGECAATGGFDALPREQFRHGGKAHVPCQEKYAQGAGFKHREGVVRPGERAEDFGVPDVRHARGAEGFLVDRRGRDGGGLPAHGEGNRAGDGFVRRAAAGGGHDAERRVFRGNIAQIEEVEDAGGVSDLGGGGDGAEGKADARRVERAAEDARVADDEGAREGGNFAGNKGFCDDFGTDSGGIARRDGDEGLLHEKNSAFRAAVAQAKGWGRRERGNRDGNEAKNTKNACVFV